MKKLYASPLRVYLCLAALAIVGIWSGLKLPVSLFPNSTKPTVNVDINYGSATANEFLNTYGRTLEEQLRAISNNATPVEQVKASYNSNNVTYNVEFKWGVESRLALREVETIVNAFGARFPKEMRDSMSVNSWNENSGFLAVSFFSSKRSLDDLYDILDPAFVPKISKVPDAADPGLWNPSRKEVRIEMVPETMAALQLFPKDIEAAVNTALSGYTGGSVTVGTKRFSVQMPRDVTLFEDLRHTLISTPSGKMVHLSDVAKIDFGPRTTDSRSIRTNGAPSIILWAEPKPGGNVKRMSEEILEIVHTTMPGLPKDIQYRVLVDPSEFIRDSIHNVFHEVAIGALLAVVVLFFFIGSFRNIVTAAIEIPMSMVLAFILMRFSGMNLNLISLGGLALSAGMNVDASVVVMENIFRHFDEVRGPLDFETRLRIVVKAVTEVRFAVIASTIASLVVFLPLAFTSELSYAILGDLAKTVVFSHGFSAIIALILVPTVRLHLMSREKGEPKPVRSPIDGAIKKLEALYARALGAFISSRKAQTIAYTSIVATLAVLAILVLPRLPKEIIGRPDTDWMLLSINTHGNTLLKQMEAQTEELEAKLFKQFGDKVQYTFTQVRGSNNATVMLRLRDKRQMSPVWKEMEKTFTDTPLTNYWAGPWNPAEMPIPNPPQLRLVVRGVEAEERAAVAEELKDLLQEKKTFPHVSANPDPSRQENIIIHPNIEQWATLWNQGAHFMPADVADLARVATNGKKAAEIPIKGRTTDIMLRYPQDSIDTMEALAALPIGVGSKIIPLKALARVEIEPVPAPIYREDGQDLFVITGKHNEEDKSTKTAASVKQSEDLIGKWKQEHSKSTASAYFEDPEKDLHEAIRQLALAVALSIGLIFLTMVMQFGSVVNSLLVLVAIPLGFIGVLLSLFIFRSTLSLNSILGVILLNGISVANSIILVDFLKRLVDQGLTPHEAAIEAGRKRLRPILITSLTTVLGMMPVALGMGEGGKILQPLGIAVSGGLWFSMGLTLFVVPALQVAYLEFKNAETTSAEINHYDTDDLNYGLGSFDLHIRH